VAAISRIPFNRDALIATYDAAGVLRRTFRHVSSKDEVDTALAYDLRGNLYVTRVFLGTNNQPNLITLKYSGNKLLWKKEAENAGIWNGDNTLISPSVSVDSKGRVFVTGGYQGTASFGGIKLHSVGSRDIFVAELKQD
jgi:hypothetical protein